MLCNFGSNLKTNQMILRSGYPFWLIKDGLPNTFPKLNQDIETNIVIVGAGISGALMRYHLMEAGIECVTVDSRTVGLGSTCASTSLLQYEIDTPLSELIGLVGKESAERAYHLCNHSIESLGKIAKKIGFSEFESRNSLYYAAYKKDTAFLKREFEARKTAGFKVHYLNDKAVWKQFGFNAPAAILSEHGAQTNAYAFAHQLLAHGKDKIYDRTRIVKTIHKKNGVQLETDNGFTIKANKIIYATGYEVTEIIDKKIVNLKSTFAVISEQYETKKFWNKNTLMWSTANPYLYLRTTPDGRILIGGRDEDFYNPKRRDALINKKAKQLVDDFRKLFPEIEFRQEFSWTGTFGETKDGLPFIGTYDKMPHCFFALGFGGNGITFSLVAAEIITDLLLGKENADAKIFSFERV
jgi:glycine/D-amino acid oxidase-like deaminating enzyme